MATGIGIIGTGWGARVQVPAFRAAGLNIVALAGSQAEKTRQIAAELDVPFASADWRELVEHPEVGLVSVTTPPLLHREMAIAVLEAGKHVLCEKPTAMNAGEAQEMLAAAEARPEQIALIDHELRFLPAMREARRLIAEGAIGELRFAECRVISSSRHDPQRPWNWWSDADQGGGALGAIGSHQIDYLRYLSGDDISAVRGTLRSFVASRPAADGPRPVTADDFAAFELQFARGGSGYVMLNTVATINEANSISFYGSSGTLSFRDGRLWYAREGESELRDITPQHSVAIPGSISGLYPEGTVYLGHALRAALHDGDRAALGIGAGFRDGLHVQAALDAVRRAGGGWETLEF